MQMSGWVIVLSAVLGGGVGGVVASWMAPEGTTAASKKGRSVAERSAEQDEDEEESETKARLRRLEHRIALLNAAMQSGDGKTSSGQLEGETAERSKAEELDVADPVFEAAVLDIMDREQERKEEKRTTSSKERHAERGRRYATDLGNALQLDSAQQGEMAQVVASYFDEWRALRDGDSSSPPATRREWQAERERMNQALEEKIRGVLGPQQYAAYQALHPDDKVGWMRGSRESEQPAGPGQNPSAPTN